MPDITLASFLLDRKTRGETFPLGPMYISSVLEQNGYRVDFRDYQFYPAENRFNVEHIVSFLKDSADIIGISTMCNFLPFLVLAIEKIKQQFPQKVVILGGPGPTAVGRQLLTSFPFLDIIVFGEGEKTVVELMEHLLAKRNLDGVSGIAFKNNGKVQVNAPREEIKDLDSLPSPYHSCKNLKDYSTIGVLSGRGCSFGYSFCSIPTVFGRKVRLRKIEKVVEEISLLYQFIENKTPMPQVFFSDDTLVMDKGRLLEFCIN